MVNLINPFEAYLVELLQGNIIVDGNVVEVRKRRPEVPVMPCITLDVQDISTDGVYRAVLEDETLVYERSTTIQLDVWSYEETSRQSINKQIMECWYNEQNQHYMYCTNYKDDVCSTLQARCEAVSTITKRCPHTRDYNYEPLLLKHNILHGGVNIEPPFDLDELGEKTPILHSVFRCNGAYREYVALPSIPIRRIQSDDDITIK